MVANLNTKVNYCGISTLEIVVIEHITAVIL